MRKGFRLIALLAVLALVAAACGDDTSDTTVASSTTATTADTGGTTTTTEEVMTGPVFDIGVTEEPCPGGNPDRGCILLGSITDQTSPVFSAASPGLLAGHELFWARVNASGGIGGLFDVDILDSAIVDGAYDAATHVEVYQGIREDVLALAESLGTSQTQAALPDMIDDNMVAAPASWWSGWNYQESDAGLILEAGASYCVEAMNAVDFAVANIEGVSTVGVVFAPGDLGADYLAGVKLAAVANGLDVTFEQLSLPLFLDPAQTEGINAVVTGAADVTFLSMGPRETATIVGSAAAAGHTMPFIGSGPTWNAGLLADDSPAAPAFKSGIYFNSTPWGPWATDSPGHAGMRQMAEAASAPPSNFISAGWVEQYPLKAALDAAVAAGDITRAGLAAAAKSLGEVDFEGMVETVADYGSNSIVTSSFISRVDPEAPDGVTAVVGPFTGPTATAHDYSDPCS